MRSERSSSWFAPTVSLFLALLLTVLPLPDMISAFRPEWVAVVMLYWTLIEPRRYGLVTAFLLGIVLDTLTGSLLGQHALALLVIVFLSQRFSLTLRTFPASQFTLIVVGLLGLHEFVLFWIDGVAGRSVPSIDRWGPVVTSGLLWLLLMLVADRGRQAAEARM
jgi:rod shape-determining protein MreD